ncbi:hypothetical protein HMPREF9075_02662 [Capnocytophaga sp. oral taxon 332 str. F0381]|nr:hypothetical protein HMPREF9075_02662 [Capnocytophaga sp. oral taxon 332 str. F0381]
MWLTPHSSTNSKFRIQNSEFLQLVPNSQFPIHNSSCWCELVART